MAGLRADPSEVAEGTDGPEETTAENEIAASEALSDGTEPAAEIPAGGEPNEEAADLPAMPAEGEQVAALDPNAAAAVTKFHAAPAAGRQRNRYGPLCHAKLDRRGNVGRRN